MTTNAAESLYCVSSSYLERESTMDCAADMNVHVQYIYV